MVEIIERGRLPDEEEYQLRCIHCQTLFKFKKREARIQFDRNEHYMQISCPLCSEMCTKYLDQLTTKDRGIKYE